MRFSLLLAFSAMALGVASAQTTAPPDHAASMPDGAGKPIVQRACASCHAVTVVTSKHATQKEWDQVVNLMVSRGAELSDDEIETVIAYLAKNYGPLDQKSAPPAADAAATTPPGDTSTLATININHAGAAEIASALGLADADADAVVKYRTQHGDFKTWQDVAAVPGISAAKIEAAQKRITF
jgi:competence ComEA-like helix-hairpin-helix protein